MSELRISALALLVATGLVAWSCASGEEDRSSTGDSSNGSGGAPDDGFLGAGAAAEPSGTEVCDNGLDDDGDGNVDEGCACAPGQEQACFPGPATQAGVGACAWGKQSCSDAGSGEFPEGTWGACVGAGQPKAEACGDGVDNDCDGATDEGCSCTTGETMSCGITQGICQAGTQTCIGGQWGDCVGGVGPELEICDGLDNNCDGQVDEGCGCTDGETKPCGQTIGACEPGTETCINGAWGDCEGAIEPTPEVCGDGVDNNCDGATDEGCDTSTATGTSASTGGGACWYDHNPNNCAGGYPPCGECTDTYCCEETAAAYSSADWLAWRNCFLHQACTTTTQCAPWPENNPPPGYTFCGPYMQGATDYECCASLQPAGFALELAWEACLEAHCVGTCL